VDSGLNTVDDSGHVNSVSNNRYNSSSIHIGVKVSSKYDRALHTCVSCMLAVIPQGEVSR